MFGAMPGMPGAQAGEGDSLTRMKPLTQTQKNAKKADRQREKDARKRNRK